MIRRIARSHFTQRRWLNGRGRSWDIAGEPPGARDDAFCWRVSLAEIAGDVAFSVYGPIDRVLTLIAGHGFDLTFATGAGLDVHDRFVPHAFPGDRAAYCRVRDGPCLALNLFVRRGFDADARVHRIDAPCTIGAPDDTLVLFALAGSVMASGAALAEGEAALARGAVRMTAPDARALVYSAQLRC